jgi:hypothetical protein
MPQLLLDICPQLCQSALEKGAKCLQIDTRPIITRRLPASFLPPQTSAPCLEQPVQEGPLAERNRPGMIEHALHVEHLTRALPKIR